MRSLQHKVVIFQSRSDESKPTKTTIHSAIKGKKNYLGQGGLDAALPKNRLANTDAVGFWEDSSDLIPTGNIFETATARRKRKSP